MPQASGRTIVQID